MSSNPSGSHIKEEPSKTQQIIMVHAYDLSNRLTLHVQCVCRLNRIDGKHNKVLMSYSHYQKHGKHQAQPRKRQGPRTSSRLLVGLGLFGQFSKRNEYSCFIRMQPNFLRLPICKPYEYHIPQYLVLVTICPTLVVRIHSIQAIAI